MNNVSIAIEEKYRYTVYGLNIESEIELPELISIKDKNLSKDKIDVRISYGDLSEQKKRVSGYVIATVDRKDMYVAVENIALYRVINGNEIIIDANEGAAINRIRSFLIGRAFGILFIQRETIAIHGSTIIKNNKGIIIAGQSGAGKTTLTAALKKKGYKFITDDVSALSNNEKSIMIKPSYPEQKVCRDTMEGLGYNIEEFQLSKKTDTRERYVMHCDDSFVNKEFPMKAFCEIVVGDETDDVKIEEISGTEKIKVLMNNGYFVNIERNMGLRQIFFTTYLKIAKNVPFYRIIRPQGKFSVDRQIELLEKVI